MKPDLSTLTFVAISLLLLIAFFPLQSVHAVVTPSARIIFVDYPKHVLVGGIVRVVVIADYSDWFPIDVGIWEPREGRMIRSLTTPNSVTPPGTHGFTFNLTAPSTQLEWHLIAITRVWWLDAWYQDPQRGTAPFIIEVSTTARLFVDSRGSDTTIRLDGSNYTLNGNRPLSLSPKPGLHSLGATQIVQGQAGQRFVFAGWSDGVNSNPRQIFVTTDTNITALYNTEFYLTAKSDLGKVSGEGWYPAGSRATIAVVPTVNVASWFGLFRDEYRFTAWSEDSHSTDAVASVIMDGPKTVKTEWKYANTAVNLAFFGYVFLAASVLLGADGFNRYSKKRDSGNRISLHTLKKSAKLLLLVSSVLISSTFVPSANAQQVTNPQEPLVKVGDAYWYYWNHEASDTCLIWLGGGISQETLLGYNYYWINPFEYESFGTILFVQDLARYYCVIALQKGSYEYFNSVAKRAIYQEQYDIQSKILAELHDWVKAQGYLHTYLVGYSVGAVAAATEVMLRDPESWTGLDGIILITGLFRTDIIEHARNIRANLLLLDAGDLPEFVNSGQQFYDKAPQEGWQDNRFFHKEFHVLSDVDHEVWTVKATGAYDPRAIQDVVNFIERSKALQFNAGILRLTENGMAVGNSSTNTNPPLNFTAVRVPSKTLPGQIIVLEGALSLGHVSQTPVTVVAYDAVRGQILSLTFVSLTATNSNAFELILNAPSNSSAVSFSLLALQKVGNDWSLVSNPHPVTIRVTGLVTLTISTSMPNVAFLFDGTSYSSPATGVLKIDTNRGIHRIQMRPTIQRSSSARIVFTQWDDGNRSPALQVNLQDDKSVMALYRRQYFVNASTSYGAVLGSGWYDENSTATLLVQPLMFEQQGIIFAHWTRDSNDDTVRTQVFVTSPKVAEAIWIPFQRSNGSALLVEIAWITLGVILLVTLMGWNIKLRKQTSRLKSEGLTKAEV